jgi:hypothetical protein
LTFFYNLAYTTGLGLTTTTLAGGGTGLTTTTLGGGTGLTTTTLAGGGGGGGGTGLATTTTLGAGLTTISWACACVLAPRANKPTMEEMKIFFIIEVLLFFIAWFPYSGS